MKLLDLDTITDTDLSEMMDREIPCDLPRLMADGPPPRWCTEVATHWVRHTCRRCGAGGGRIFACPPCARFLRQGIRIGGLVISPWLRHNSCRLPGIFRVTSGPL